MIYYLIEIVFSDFPNKNIVPFIMKVVSEGANVSDWTLTCEYKKIDWKNSDSILEIFRKNDNFGFFINIKSLEVFGCDFTNCGIGMYKNEGKINVELNFEYSDLNKSNNKKVTPVLMRLARVISNEYGAPDYFCGIDPAHDENTRLFTKEVLGPMASAF